MHRHQGLAALALDWLDEGSFHPRGALLDEDGGGELLAGVGRRKGRPLLLFASEPGRTKSAVGVSELDRICWALEEGRRRAWPVVGLLSSSGARVHEGLRLAVTGSEMVGRLAALADTPTPLLVGIDEACVGLAGLVAAAAEFCVMTEDSWLALAGPAVVQAGLGGGLPTPLALGGHGVHAGSGMIHQSAPDRHTMMDTLDTVLDYLAAIRTEAAPVPPDATPGDLVPENPRELFDMHRLLRAVVDAGSFLEYAPEFGLPQIAGFARVEGLPVGLLASNPMAKAGALDTDACRKAARFVRMLRDARLPLVQFIDTPGGMPDAVENGRGLMAAYMSMMHALGQLRTLRVTFVLRRLYGGALSMTGHWRWHGDLVYAWPQANLGLMGPTAASAIRKEMRSDAARADLEARQRDLSEAGRLGLIDDVVTPDATRSTIASLLADYHDGPGVGRWT